MDIFIRQHNYQSKHLVVIDGGVYDYKNEKYKFDRPFLSFKSKRILIGILKARPLTQTSGANDRSGFEGNTPLLGCENNEYVYISGLENFKFKTVDKYIDYISLMGNNMVPFYNWRKLYIFHYSSL